MTGEQKPGGLEVVAWPVVTDQWAETYCELTGRDPDGQQVTFVDGGTVTTFRDMARREIEAMLCAAPKSAVRTIATAEPAEARIRELERKVEVLNKRLKLRAKVRDTWESRATAAEAKLAKAKEALKEVLEADLLMQARSAANRGIEALAAAPAVQPTAGKEVIVNRDDGPLLDHHRLGVDREDLAAISTLKSTAAKKGEIP